MSALAEHPNVIEARDLRRREIEHAMRCLYRDHTWIDPDGDLPVYQWLDRIHYLRDRILRTWLRASQIDPLATVGELTEAERDRLVWQMVRYLKGLS